MKETTRKYTTKHKTVYTQKIITNDAGEFISEIWMKGDNLLKGGVYISSEHADKAGSYFKKHLGGKDKKEAETFVLRMIEDLKKLSYSQTNGVIVFFDDKVYRSSAVEEVSPEFEGGILDEDIEKTLAVPDDKKSGSGLEDALADELALSSDQGPPTKPLQVDYNQPPISQIKPDQKGTLRSKTKPAEKKPTPKKGFFSNLFRSSEEKSPKKKKIN